MEGPGFGYTAAMATDSDTRQQLHRLIDQLSENQLGEAAKILEHLGNPPLDSLLREIPGAQPPDCWPPQYANFAPLPVAGEPPSERLIRERR